MCSNWDKTCSLHEMPKTRDMVKKRKMITLYRRGVRGVWWARNWCGQKLGASPPPSAVGCGRNLSRAQIRVRLEKNTGLNWAERKEGCVFEMTRMKFSRKSWKEQATGEVGLSDRDKLYPVGQGRSF